ncbi:uncharacterized protein LOC143028493 [Oratosquilla oratoria]|uniref:uncharacterized protein LOC143028493 n=1 Tax=Oratosquilla oratoria TaxID=337810 RepID=UPI003F76B9E7
MDSKSILKRQGSVDTRSNKSVRLSIGGTENIPGQSPTGKQHFIQPKDMREQFKNLETSMRSMWKSTDEDAPREKSREAEKNKSNIYGEKSFINITTGLPPYLTNTNFGPCYTRLKESKPAHDFQVVPMKDNKRMRFRNVIRNYDTNLNGDGERPTVMVVGDAEVRNIIEERLSTQLRDIKVAVNFHLGDTITAKQLRRAAFLVAAVELDSPRSVFQLDTLYTALNSSSNLTENSCVLAFMSRHGKFGNTICPEFFKNILQKWQLHHYIIHKEAIDKTLEFSKINWRSWENLAMDISRCTGRMTSVGNLALWGLRRPFLTPEEDL